MDFKTLWPLRLPRSQQPQAPQDNDRLIQEDEETRRIIAHYLLLADQLLSADSMKIEEDERSAAA
jgi:hypothetical protein